MSKPALTLYFDGACPFCVAEITRLRSWDEQGRIRFVDIAVPEFEAPPGVDLAALNREMHGRTAEGAWLTGIDCIVAAYDTVGRGWLVAPLRVRAMRPLFRRGYRLFARHRQRISRWLGLKVEPMCTDGRCALRGRTDS
ncbi:thiol-disulfide oxidoreductase DCC family protein [Paraburkholderia phosphatilytica]|uniref:thiol-disulfide oxidoreductase DCC family protein n=1 Tax=Paraburkholderia phosphatilytica TaxID=2282883 RepID=UPI0013DED19D|nr:DUF393 domain-containing protein [Paraburkholderia phosphatilytica]